jgi:hypothetical protein
MTGSDGLEFEQMLRARYGYFDIVEGHGEISNMTIWGGSSSRSGNNGSSLDLRDLEPYGIKPYDKPIRQGGSGRRVVLLLACQGGKMFIEDDSITSNALKAAKKLGRPVLAADGNILMGVTKFTTSYNTNNAFKVEGDGAWYLHMPDGRKIPVSLEAVRKMAGLDRFSLEEIESKLRILRGGSSSSRGGDSEPSSVPSAGGTCGSRFRSAAGLVGKGMGGFVGGYVGETLNSSGYGTLAVGTNLGLAGVGAYASSGWKGVGTVGMGFGASLASSYAMTSIGANDTQSEAVGRAVGTSVAFTRAGVPGAVAYAGSVAASDVGSIVASGRTYTSYGGTWGEFASETLSNMPHYMSRLLPW